MKEIVDAIMKEEQEAKLRVEEARKKARQLSLDKESRARDEAARIIQQAKDEAVRIVQEARDAAQKEKQKQIAHGQEKIEKLRFERKQRVHEAVEEVFKAITFTNL